MKIEVIEKAGAGFAVRKRLWPDGSWFYFSAEKNETGADFWFSEHWVNQFPLALFQTREAALVFAMQQVLTA